MEARDEALRRGEDLAGVQVVEERDRGLHVTRVTVSDEKAGDALGKLPGTYVTVEAPGLRERDLEVAAHLVDRVAGELQRLHPLSPGESVLVVGLGNWQATADALGPRTVQRILVTRHLRGHVPADVEGRLRPVAALSPGVLGLTGVETRDIVRGVVREIAPQLVVAVDALAALSVGRLGTTVQLADTGIQPGSGVGNHRSGLTRDTLGVPVVAIGVPTVVPAGVIAGEAMVQLAGSRGKGRAKSDKGDNGQAGLGPWVQQQLDPALASLIVTPKEVDRMIQDLARLLARALDRWLQGEVADDPAFRQALH